MSDPTARFSDRVADYVRYRPHYPAAVLDVLRAELGLTRDDTVADVGSGTGISAELFLANGNEVHAVEPNDAMRAAAGTALADEPRFHSHRGRAEATGLAAASVDLVVAGQAFHWFDPPAARLEFRRVLRPPHRTALLWNRRVTTGTPFLEEYEALLCRWGTDYQAVRHDRIDAAALRGFFGARPTLRTLPNQQVLDFDGLRGRLLSSSYVPAADDPDRAPMLDELRDLFDRHERGGAVRVEYVTEVYTGRLG